MLERKAYLDLLHWKQSHAKSCLMVNGARQVGKTFLIREFGNKEYKSFIEINFIKNPDLKTIFSSDLSADTIYKKITAMIKGANLVASDTLLFFDEIQACGNARTSLKFLAEDGKYDVIVSGSLLGLTYGQDDDPSTEIPDSIPTGYEDFLTLYPLDFEEFLWANGYKKNAIANLKEFYDKKEKIPFEINNKFESLFLEYIVVGGMPEVVNCFVQTSDYSKVSKIQRKILEDYNFDIVKHAKGSEKIKIKSCYESIPSQLARELKKFKYSSVEKGQTSKKYGNSIQWLIDSGLVNPSYAVHEPQIPLLANCNKDQFKLYFNDTGLLMEAYGFETKKALLSNTLIGNAKGGIFENVISELLVKKGYKLYYFRPNENQEIEFLLEKDGKVIPLEVKAGNNVSISLNNYLEKYNSTQGIKLINGNLGIDVEKIVLPHYMVLFL